MDQKSSDTKVCETILIARDEVQLMNSWWAATAITLKVFQNSAQQFLSKFLNSLKHNNVDITLRKAL